MWCSWHVWQLCLMELPVVLLSQCPVLMVQTSSQSSGCTFHPRQEYKHVLVFHWLVLHLTKPHVPQFRVPAEIWELLQNRAKWLWVRHQSATEMCWKETIFNGLSHILLLIYIYHHLFTLIFTNQILFCVFLSHSPPTGIWSFCRPKSERTICGVKSNIRSIKSQSSETCSGVSY